MQSLFRRSLSTRVSSVWQTTRPGEQFSLSNQNGFISRYEPLSQLPSEFAPLEQIMQNMPIFKKDGTPGLIGTQSLGSAVENTLPLLDVSRVTDQNLKAALFRDYSLLCSAYCLEPSHHGMVTTGVYTQGRKRIPRQIAIPLTRLANDFGSYPWLDYAYGYGLNNWSFIDRTKPATFENLKTVRQFEGGNDESGFILIHAAMVHQSNRLVDAQMKAIESASRKNISDLTHALNYHADVMNDIYAIFTKMWKASRPSGYLSFRTFIMGITGNPGIFPDGVIYEGIGDEKPRFYRGETGAQDSLIPSSDNLLQMGYPVNKLTEYLLDLRSYRPTDHRAYLDWVAVASKAFDVKQQALSHLPSSVALLRNLDVIQQFRTIHWSMTKRYIIDQTKHPVATGGTPITSWLPNQLGATLEYMDDVIARIEAAGGEKALSVENGIQYRYIKQGALSKIDSLKQEVFALQKDFDKNDQLHQEFEKRNK